MLLLLGELGAGKTTLVRGLARGLDVSYGVKSPSFVIHLRYPGRLTLNHVDLYRVTGGADLQELGLDDIVGRDGVCVVEWGERLGPYAPPEALRILFTEPSPEVRRLTCSGERERVARLAGVVGMTPEPISPSGSR